MSSRRQRTKQFNNLILERIDKLFEISKTQSIIKISIRFIFESKSFFVQFTIDVQNVVFLSKNVNMIDVIANQNDFIKQMKQKLTIMKIEKRRLYLRHKLIQIKTEKKTNFSVIVFEISKSFRKNVELQAVISLKKNLKSKTSKLYFDDIQKFFDRWIKKCANEFDFKSNIY